tara:strand:- start:1408 stop:1890 length:483 start_codon:yes stop_codon:yes gene_type:complete
MISFFNIFKKQNYDYASMIETIVVEMKDHLTKIFNKNGAITSKNLTDYLKELDATFNPIGDKISSKTKDFNFFLERPQPLLKPFQFFIYLNSLPEYFSIEVMGDNEFAGFLLNYDSNKKEIEVRCKYINSGLPQKPTKDAETLMKKLIKKKLFVKDSFYK